MTATMVQKENPRLLKYALMLNEQIALLQPPPAPHVRRDQFEMLAEYLPCIIWTADPDGTMTFFNHRYRELTGSDGVDHHTNVLHPEDAARCAAVRRCNVTARRVHRSHARLRTTTGHYRHAVSRAVPIFDEAGDVSFWVGSAVVIEPDAMQELRVA